MSMKRVMKWMKKGGLMFGGTVLFLLITGSIAWAADPGGGSTLLSDPKAPVDYVWVLMSAFLVFLMQAGFAMLEGGLCRAKNTANLMLKKRKQYDIR